MKNVSTDRLTEIASECLDLMGVSSMFDFLEGRMTDMGRMEARLQEVMQSRHRLESIEIAMYLRTTFSKALDLPSWQPLLNVAVEQGIIRGDPIEDIFYGLMPNRLRPLRNTGYPK